MAAVMDVLREKLKQFDEITLLELLDISSEEILERFSAKVKAKKDYLMRELEIMNIDSEELEEEDTWDGFQQERQRGLEDEE